MQMNTQLTFTHAHKHIQILKYLFIDLPLTKAIKNQIHIITSVCYVFFFCFDPCLSNNSNLYFVTGVSLLVQSWGLLYGKCVRLTEDFQVSSDGDVGVFDRAGVLSAVIMTSIGQLERPVGQQGDTRVRQQRNPVLTLPTKNTYTHTHTDIDPYVH